MSNRAISAVIDYGRLKGPHLALMLVIADGISKDTGQYHAKIATLARECHCSERAVQRSIGACIRAGELIVQEGVIYPNTFYIPMYEGEPGYHPQPCDDPTHTCTKHHTPLTVSRDDARAEDVKHARAAARRQYPRRGDGSVTPTGARGDGSVTPPVTEVSPPGDGSVAPPVTEVAPFTLSLTPSLTPVVTDGPTAHEKKAAGQSAEPERTPPTPPLPPSPAPSAGDWRPAPALWQDVLDALGPSISPARRDTYFRPAQLLADADGAAYVVVATTAQAADLLSGYREAIAGELGTLTRRRGVAVDVRRKGSATR